MPRPTPFDVLILGSGAAGLVTALRLADRGISSLVVSKGRISEGSTLYAQGGISAVLDEGDSIDAHVADTLAAGAGLCNRAAVQFTVERGADAVHWLIDKGVRFTPSDTDDGFAYHLTREGGHSHRRIIHADDATGRAVEKTLMQLARAHPNIQLLAHHMAVDLIRAKDRIVGAYLLNIRSGTVDTYPAKATVLATGGASMVYLYSSNPHGATGDGIAMAWRAGCRIANMEFMQFHPTCLFHPEARNFLITEALRGEGALLLRPDGTRFMPGFDERAELAPRDIVARAIDHEMKRLGLDHVLLDTTELEPDFLRQHFPTIHARCLELRLDPTQRALPVVPAAHYTCGGVLTDLNGRTDLAGLYAVGETASTGLHGANRMASNSLLECLVFGTAAAEDLASRIQQWPTPGNLLPWDASQVRDSDEEVVVSHNWQELRRCMWDYVGIVRTTKRLERAQHRVQLLSDEVQEYYGNFHVTPDLIELRHLLTVSELIVHSAASRHESRGLHFIRDFPDTEAVAKDTVLTPDRVRIRDAA